MRVVPMRADMKKRPRKLQGCQKVNGPESEYRPLFIPVDETRSDGTDIRARAYHEQNHSQQ